MSSLFSEFRRRNVFKVGITYLVVAWLLIQIADILAPQLSLPDWAPRIVTFILLLGFPLALVLAWLLDVTPEGVKTEAGSGKDKVLYLIAAVFVVASIGWYTWSQPDEEITSNERSIAVLPFVNVSGDQENEYFSDGVSDEIRTNLSGMPELRVAARTSSFEFKNQEIAIQDIAQQLNVGLVLEGTVRRQDDQVRITAQLAEANDGFQVWSATYDRRLEDIFATQDEIAAAIASALQLEFDAGQQSQHQVDPAVYDLYLQARALLYSRETGALPEAASVFEDVIAADPMFAEAYAGLGQTYTVMPLVHPAPPREIRAKAQNAAEHALALDPDNSEAFGALGDVASHALRFSDAGALIERALLLNPSSVMAHIWRSELQLFVGDLEGSVESHLASRRFDPLHPAGISVNAIALLGMDKLEEAKEGCGFDEIPDSYLINCRGAELIVALAEPNYAATRAILLDRASSFSEIEINLANTIADALESNGDHSALTQQLTNMPYHAFYDPNYPAIVEDVELPTLLLALGEPNLAIEQLKINLAIEPRNTLYVIWIPQLDPIRCDSGFQEIVSSLDVVDQRAARICN
jgi:TolB-like protein